MKRLTLAMAFLAITAPCFAAPYLVSDPATDNATSCVFESFQLPCVMDATKAIHVDLATLPVGTHSVRAQFCAQNGRWCSAYSANFTFTKPNVGSPSILKLSVQ